MGRLTALLASQNAHKLAELQAALSDWDLLLLAADDYPPEAGATYLDNARGKARFGRSLAPDAAWVLGEDSGIEVAALGGRPGVGSARWAVDGVAALLDELDGISDRRARYVCELVGVSPSGDEVRGSGVLVGTVAAEARGEEGFGYDPIFIPDGETRTVAELGDGWKRANSHRARAAQAFAGAVART